VANIYSVTDYTGPTIVTSGGMGYYDAGSKGTNMQYNVKMTNIWKGHEIRYGVQYEGIDYSGARQYSGPKYLTYKGVMTSSGAMVRIYPGANYCSRFPGTCGLDRVYYVARNAISPSPIPTSTKYLNWFAQDSWNLTSYLNVKYGIRWEQQQMNGTLEGSNDITLPASWAPRVGATYDYLKNGKSKAFFHYGRFFEKIPNDLAVRALNPELTTVGLYYDAALAHPVIGSGSSGGVNPTTVEGLGNWDTAGTFKTPYKTKPQYSNEYIAGIEQEVGKGLSLGGRFIFRNVGRVLEDTQIDLGPGADLSNVVPYTGVDPSILVPPGMVADEGFWLSNSSAYFITNIDGHYPGFPAMTRDYKALELTFEKRMSNNWQLMGSYRYATLKGNYEGLFRRDNGQSDPNITSLGDFAQCHANPDGSCTPSNFIGYTFAAGPLPNQQKHVVKLYATYQFNFGLNAGGGVNYNTGNPRQEMGAIAYYGSYERLLTPRGGLGNSPSITTVDIHADYNLKLGAGKMIFGMDVFNLFNAQNALNYDDGSQQDNLTWTPPPNPDYKLITEYQLPRAVRFLVKYQF
jgi:hypothetical protein